MIKTAIFFKSYHQLGNWFLKSADLRMIQDSWSEKWDFVKLFFSFFLKLGWSVLFCKFQFQEILITHRAFVTKAHAESFVFVKGRTALGDFNSSLSNYFSQRHHNFMWTIMKVLVNAIEYEGL